MFRPVALLLFLPLAAPAAAQSRDMRIENESGGVVVRLYSAPSHEDSFHDDLLGSRQLGPGESMDATMTDVTGCYYDLRVEFTDGSSFEDVVDVCTEGRYVIN